MPESATAVLPSDRTRAGTSDWIEDVDGLLIQASAIAQKTSRQATAAASAAHRPTLRRGPGRTAAGRGGDVSSRSARRVRGRMARFMFPYGSMWTGIPV